MTETDSAKPTPAASNPLGLPHRYNASSSARVDGYVRLESPGLEPIDSAGPVQFGGPGDRWSPETLLMAALADCFVLGFRAIAKASSFTWHDLRCEVEGTLDRVERTTRFTGVHLRAFLTVPPGSDETKALRLLDKAERSCLVANSLVCPVELEPHVAVG